MRGADESGGGHSQPLEEPTMRQSRIGFLLAALVSAIAVSGQLVSSGGRSPADILYAKPGQLVSANGFRLNLALLTSSAQIEFWSIDGGR